MTTKSRYSKLKARKELKRNGLKLLIQVLAWIGVAMLYYIGFSIFFDTPYEHELRQSTNKLEREYNALSARYDSLELALQNVVDRDKGVFRTIFESNPYDFDSDYNEERLSEYEVIFTKSRGELNDVLNTKMEGIEQKMEQLVRSNDRLVSSLESAQSGARSVPAIQPIANRQLTLLTASYGMRMHPFYKTLTSHQGVDFTVPEGTRVFATADGVVKQVTINSSAGRSIILDHGNGYKSTYSHLGSTNVGRGTKVQRGDIIALSGNTGLSITPHLHYEVSYNDMRVDPVHYFFMELSPFEYQRMLKVAQSGMQSFD